jgi:hypothetical protein
MHPSFESLVVINTWSWYASLMDINHDTFLKSILEDDFIFSASKVHIHSCLGKGAGLWLIVYIYPFILHCTLYFHLNVEFLSWFDLAFNM